MHFFFQAEDCIRDFPVTGVQTCALPIWLPPPYSCRSTNPGTTYLPLASMVSAAAGASSGRTSPTTLFPFINIVFPLINVSPVNTVPLVIAKYASAMDIVCALLIELLYDGNHP